ncbi:MAG: hypothetical protein JXR73_11615 [Candidatus Omnitrophica bacterium]|nr:hypothetical protein [Candidatus Omnitrophota bacterium]
MKRILQILTAFSLFLSCAPSSHASDFQDKMARKSLAELIVDLHDDDIRFNAIHAWQELIFRRGPEKTAPLEKALDSKDWQQRQIAADILRHIDGYQPTDRLIEATVEGLRDDKLPGWFSGEGQILLYNATEGMRYLLLHPTLGAKPLEKALNSDEKQQRFLAAFVLGATGRSAQIEKMAQILIPHLKHDDTRLNACMAAHALYKSGEAVIPFLSAYRDSPDEQQRAAVRLILMDLKSPPKTKAELLARRKFHDLSPTKPDPAFQLWSEDRFSNMVPAGIVGKPLF